MAKKRKNKFNKFINNNYWKIMIPILVLLIVVSLIFIAFKFPTLIPQTIFPAVSYDNFEESTPSRECTFELDKSIACVDENIRGTLTNGANAICSVFFKYEEEEWDLLRNVELDFLGKFTTIESADEPGNYLFSAICEEEDGSLCRTNNAEITIEDCIPEEECFDSDGTDPNYPGYVDDLGIEYFDDCVDETKVKEYYCNTETGSYHSYIYYCLPGTKCIEQAGGDYCLEYTETCTDSDGDNPNSPGHVDWSGSTFTDDCLSNSAVNEYVCADGRMKTYIATCSSDRMCIDGSSGGYCALPPPIDSDGDGYSDDEENDAGTNPNDPNSYPGGLAEQTADYCKDLGFSWAKYMPSSSASGCLGEAYDVCFPIFGLQYEDSLYSNPHCCFKCS